MRSLVHLNSFYIYNILLVIIFSIIVNNNQSAILSGFGYNPNDNIFVYVFEDQIEKSKKILESLTV